MKSNKITGLSVVGLMQIACLIVAVCSVLPLLAEVIWYSDLLSSFRFQYLVLSIFFTAGFLIARQYVYVVISVCCFLLNAFYVVPVFFGSPDGNDDQQNGIKLFHANVYTTNKEKDKLIQQLRAVNPDVVLLQEVNVQWLTMLHTIKTQYPYSIEVPREDNFGMAVFSQVPIKAHQIHDWTDLDIPSIELEIENDGQVIRIITTHPPPPVNRYYYDAGKQQFEAIAATIKNTNIPSIVIGDLNTTVWSKHYPILTTKAGLVNASAGQGYMPTWPTNLWPFMIPIDHCLVSEHFTVINIKTSESFGSDHWPLIVELGI